MAICQPTPKVRNEICWLYDYGYGYEYGKRTILPWFPVQCINLSRHGSRNDIRTLQPKMGFLYSDLATFMTFTILVNYYQRNNCFPVRRQEGVTSFTFDYNFS
jgi:hypothetical protein